MAFNAHLLLLLSSAVFATSNAQEDIRLPPSIAEGPVKEDFYRPNQKAVLPCIAIGHPIPTIKWLKNGAELSFTGIILPNPIPGDGTIEIEQMGTENEGFYQCLASNPSGSTMSNVSLVQLANLGPFDPNAPNSNYTVMTNSHLRIPCNSPSSQPDATYSWSKNTPQNFVNMSKWIQIDFNGDLCFASVRTSDVQGNTFRCNVRNEALALTASSKYSSVSVAGNVGGVAPALMFSSPSKVVGLTSEQTILRCFFSGSDNSGQNTVSYSWTYNGNNILPTGWTIFDSEIRSPSSGTPDSDAGTFVCTGSNSLGHASATIELAVEAIPDFGDIPNQPRDMNVTEGDTVEISCQSNAVPEANIQWYKNTVPFDEKSLPPKFTLSPDLLTLTISDVCKNCSDGTSDLMNIQCNASNEHGYAFGQGYVNVLLATTITSEPVTVTWEPYLSYEFGCQATCDDSTPCTREWTFEGNTIEPDGTALVIDDEGTLRIVTANDSDAGAARIGRYECIVSNDYSQHSINSTIVGAKLATAELWWVGLLVALLILLLLLLVLLFIFCCFCREGKSYPVDKNERKNGNDPVKELKDTGMQHYAQTSSKPINVYTNPVVFGMADLAPPNYNERLVVDRDASLTESRNGLIQNALAIPYNGGNYPNGGSEV